jgi:hypothetical protein
MDAWFAPDPDPFAFFVELQPQIMTLTRSPFRRKPTKARESDIIPLIDTLTFVSGHRTRTVRLP